jgi:hypothetical protein
MLLKWKAILIWLILPYLFYILPLPVLAFIVNRDPLRNRRRLCTLTIWSSTESK